MIMNIRMMTVVVLITTTIIMLHRISQNQLKTAVIHVPSCAVCMTIINDHADDDECDDDNESVDDDDFFL